ncbi:MAG: hypothetical protein KJ587_09920 [Alphaproteobacteria bacterium]|nr:hypothetical protein [Alphaproteobacteria bacterium]
MEPDRLSDMPMEPDRLSDMPMEPDRLSDMPLEPDRKVIAFTVWPRIQLFVIPTFFRACCWPPMRRRLQLAVKESQYG